MGHDWSMFQNLSTWVSVLDESVTDGTERRKEVASGKKVAEAIRSLVNARNLQFECAMVLQEVLLMSVLLYESETVVQREKEKSRIRAIQIDNFRGPLDVSRRYRMPNARIKEL